MEYENGTPTFLAMNQKHILLKYTVENNQYDEAKEAFLVRAPLINSYQIKH